MLFGMVKFIYSEKATRSCEIFTLLLSYVVPVKIKVTLSQNCVAFSEYMNFKEGNNSLRIELIPYGQSKIVPKFLLQTMFCRISD